MMGFEVVNSGLHAYSTAIYYFKCGISALKLTARQGSAVNSHPQTLSYQKQLKLSISATTISGKVMMAGYGSIVSAPPRAQSSPNHNTST